MDRAFSWVTKKIGIKTTPYKGMGVFAHNAIVKNELIIVMGGYIFSIEDENHLNAFNEDKPLEIAEDFSLSPQNESDMKRMPQHYFNHSCNPNVGFKGQLFMVATRDIKKSEELCFDYAMILHPNPHSTGYFTMDCKCESLNCRKKVTETDWENPELQKKYNGYFQWYIQEKIDGRIEKPYILPEDFYKTEK